MVQAKISNISLGTIYRNLTKLAQEHKILELNIDGISHYDGNIDPHHHFVCKDCKTIIDCYTKNDSYVNNINEIEDFDIQEINVVFSGYCQECKLN